jgi:hypothetical protein
VNTARADATTKETRCVPMENYLPVFALLPALCLHHDVFDPLWIFFISIPALSLTQLCFTMCPN